MTRRRGETLRSVVAAERIAGRTVYAPQPWAPGGNGGGFSLLRSRASPRSSRPAVARVTRSGERCRSSRSDEGRSAIASTSVISTMCASRSRNRTRTTSPRRAHMLSPSRRSWPRARSATTRKDALPMLEAGVIVLYQRCTHLGCRVPWCATSQWFECPCHGAKFDQIGEHRHRSGAARHGPHPVVDRRRPPRARHRQGAPGRSPRHEHHAPAAGRSALRVMAMRASAA